MCIYEGLQIPGLQITKIRKHEVIHENIQICVFSFIIQLSSFVVERLRSCQNFVFSKPILHNNFHKLFRKTKTLIIFMFAHYEQEMVFNKLITHFQRLIKFGTSLKLVRPIRLKVWQRNSNQTNL